MKLGQTLSVFEAAVPEEVAAPYREALVKLQEEAPPMPVRTVHAVLAQQLGGKWRERFRDFDDAPAAAASIGQVHRATWRDGRDVAVKIQYPGAATALMADLNQLARFARLFAALFPGMDVKPLIAELKARVVEELDYGLEADAQRTFAAAYAGDAQIVVPRGGQRAEGHRLGVARRHRCPGSSPTAPGTARPRRAPAGRAALLRPQRAGLPRRSPPGNFRLLADGRLGVIDFGATARLPDGHPEPIGRLLRWALAGKADEVLTDLRAEGFIRPNMEVDAQGVLDYLRPLLEPVVDRHFHFTGRGCRSRPPDRRSPDGREPARPAAEPSPGLPADPPGDDRVDRCAVPARRQGRLPGRRRGMAPRLRGVGEAGRPGPNAPGAFGPGLLIRAAS